jgi:vancomycin resistance protein YoaR
MIGFVLIYQVAYTNRVYPGVKALGNDLGGYSRDEAALILQRSLDESARRRLAVRYEELSWSLTAQELGLKTDLAPVLDSVFAVGREGNLITRFWTQFGLWRQGRSFEHPSAAFDQDVQTAVLQRLAREVDRPMVEARLTVKPDFSIDYQPAQSSRKLDLESSRQRFQEALASPSLAEVELAVHETKPRGAPENLALARDQAARILSGPVVLKHQERTWTLDQAQLASIMRFSQDPGAKEAAFLDRPALEAWSKSLAEAVEQEPQDARFAWAGGALETIRPSRDGVKLDLTGTVNAIIAAAASEQREIPLVAQITKPAVSVEDRQNLGIKELIESSRTGFAGASPAKRDNITLAASRLNGTVVPPGATFSFNKEIGSTSLDAGFKLGWGITSSSSGVKTVPSVAGGICQVSTTLFHSVFWAGFPIEQRNWHLYWIPSYTSKGIVGLDSTVDEESGLDFQFINPHETHLLIQSWVDGSSINFALYGTRPPWTVKVGPSDLTDLVPAERGRIYTEEESTMPEGQRLQVESANDGFVVTTTRTVIEEGKEDRILKLVSRYKPSRNVILVGTGGRPPSGRTQSQPSGLSDDSSQNRPAPAQSVPSTNAAPTAAPVVPTAAPKSEPAPKSAPAAPKTAPAAPVKEPAAPKREPAPTAAPKPKPGTVATPSRPPVQPATAPQTKPASQR